MGGILDCQSISLHQGFISGNTRMSCRRSSSNNSLIWEKEYSRAWCSWSEGRLSSFLCLSTFWCKTCVAIGAVVRGVFLLLRGLSHTAFWMTSSRHYIGLFPASYYWENRWSVLQPLSLALFLRLFRWISILYTFMHRSLNPLLDCGMSVVERLCQKLLKGICAPVPTGELWWSSWCFHHLYAWSSSILGCQFIFESCRMPKEILLLCCQLIMDLFERFVYQAKAAPSNVARRCVVTLHPLQLVGIYNRPAPGGVMSKLFGWISGVVKHSKLWLPKFRR